MIIIPAIDILGGKAVRLYKGDYKQPTIYGEPVEIAMKFKSMGAKYIHVVDLDGAKAGATKNFGTIEQVAKILPIEIGGGIRDMATIDRYLQIADRVILGTIATENLSIVDDAIAKYGEDRIMVGVDVRDGKVAVNGWLEATHLDYLEFIDSLSAKYIICTDITRDGTLTEPNWGMYKDIKGKNVVVSGGVACDDDIFKARDMGVYGVIVGKAYYEGKVDLERCLKSV
ncbi:MAG: 1-(5-phosphoribosyl)-5-[(5-phosphoribosylamino)methylideneamino]imidazole-4-carboxamide isomerase [Clostridiales bacterium]|jgi:phosphoribosylformimino-5-aminoimidazole carboxamide ribotide isomerase|nr:1-(5-phosphoribosyl)-5-[(5-phosphoribosylamino)methylideneamino]imidazole-4-carboxamide isomerase [Clostridiales bacterium]